MQRAGLSRQTRFSPKVQDRLAVILLNDAGYQNFLTGKLSRCKFMRNLAKIWAGLPLKNGRSYYHAYAGNRATISRSFYETQFNAIFAS